MLNRTVAVSPSQAPGSECIPRISLRQHKVRTHSEIRENRDSDPQNGAVISGQATADLQIHAHTERWCEVSFTELAPRPPPSLALDRTTVSRGANASRARSPDSDRGGGTLRVGNLPDVVVGGVVPALAHA